jgi:hypothetical protein
MAANMAHKSSRLVPTQIYGLLSVLVLAVGIIVNYSIRPDLFGASIAYSTLGIQPVTAYIFSGTLLAAAFFFLYESHYIRNRLQRYACYSISLGFSIVAIVPINQGETTDLIHGIGTTIALVGLFLSLFLGVSNRWNWLRMTKRVVYVIMIVLAILATVITILSSNRLGVLNLLGFAELSGLTVFAGWIMLDFVDNTVLT